MVGGIYDNKDVETAIDIILESDYWPEDLEGGDHKRKHDDTDGKNGPEEYLIISIDFCGDVRINIPPGKWRELRFRTPGGGGHSERVRKALVILAEAIRRDNEKNPEP